MSSLSNHIGSLAFAAVILVVVYVIARATLRRFLPFSHYFAVYYVLTMPEVNSNLFLAMRICAVLKTFKSREEFDEVLERFGYRYVNHQEFLYALSRSSHRPIDLDDDSVNFPLVKDEYVAIVKIVPRLEPRRSGILSPNH